MSNDLWHFTVEVELRLYWDPRSQKRSLKAGRVDSGGCWLRLGTLRASRVQFRHGRRRTLLALRRRSGAAVAVRRYELASHREQVIIMPRCSTISGTLQRQAGNFSAPSSVSPARPGCRLTALAPGLLRDSCILRPWTPPAAFGSSEAPF